MATVRALSHLNALVELVERADLQIGGLAVTLGSVIEQMDAVMEDGDLEVAEVLVEEATGAEVEFRLSQVPVRAGSVTVYVNDEVVGDTSYEVDEVTGVITPLVAVPAGSEVRAEYVVMGLASQVVVLLNQVPALDAAYFLERKARYQQATAWITENFGGV